MERNTTSLSKLVESQENILKSTIAGASTFSNDSKPISKKSSLQELAESTSHSRKRSNSSIAKRSLSGKESVHSLETDTNQIAPLSQANVAVKSQKGSQKNFEGIQDSEEVSKGRSSKPNSRHLSFQNLSFRGDEDASNSQSKQRSRTTSAAKTAPKSDSRNSSRADVISINSKQTTPLARTPKQHTIPSSNSGSKPLSRTLSKAGVGNTSVAVEEVGGTDKRQELSLISQDQSEIVQEEEANTSFVPQSKSASKQPSQLDESQKESTESANNSQSPSRVISKAPSKPDAIRSVTNSKPQSRVISKNPSKPDAADSVKPSQHQSRVISRKQSESEAIKSGKSSQLQSRTISKNLSKAEALESEKAAQSSSRSISKKPSMQDDFDGPLSDQKPLSKQATLPGSPAKSVRTQSLATSQNPIQIDASEPSELEVTLPPESAAVSKKSSKANSSEMLASVKSQSSMMSKNKIEATESASILPSQSQSPSISKKPSQINAENTSNDVNSRGQSQANGMGVESKVASTKNSQFDLNNSGNQETTVFNDDGELALEKNIISEADRELDTPNADEAHTDRDTIQETKNFDTTSSMKNISKVSSANDLEAVNADRQKLSHSDSLKDGNEIDKNARSENGFDSSAKGEKVSASGNQSKGLSRQESKADVARKDKSVSSKSKTGSRQSRPASRHGSRPLSKAGSFRVLAQHGKDDSLEHPSHLRNIIAADDDIADEHVDNMKDTMAPASKPQSQSAMVVDSQAAAEADIQNSQRHSSRQSKADLNDTADGPSPMPKRASLGHNGDSKASIAEISGSQEAQRDSEDERIGETNVIVLESEAKQSSANFPDAPSDSKTDLIQEINDAVVSLPSSQPLSKKGSITSVKGSQKQSRQASKTSLSVSRKTSVSKIIEKDSSNRPSQISKSKSSGSVKDQPSTPLALNSKPPSISNSKLASKTNSKTLLLESISKESLKGKSQDTLVTSSKKASAAGSSFSLSKSESKLSIGSRLADDDPLIQELRNILTETVEVPDNDEVVGTDQWATDIVEQNEFEEEFEELCWELAKGVIREAQEEMAQDREKEKGYVEKALSRPSTIKSKKDGSASTNKQLSISENPDPVEEGVGSSERQTSKQISHKGSGTTSVMMQDVQEIIPVSEGENSNHLDHEYKSEKAFEFNDEQKAINEYELDFEAAENRNEEASEGDINETPALDNQAQDEVPNSGKSKSESISRAASQVNSNTIEKSVSEISTTEKVQRPSTAKSRDQSDQSRASSAKVSGKLSNSTIERLAANKPGQKSKLSITHTQDEIEAIELSHVGPSDSDRVSKSIPNKKPAKEFLPAIVPSSVQIQPGQPINYVAIVANLRRELGQLKSELGIRDDAIAGLKEKEHELRVYVDASRLKGNDSIDKNTRILLDRQKKAYQILVAKLRREVRRLNFQKNSLSDPLIESKYFPYLPRTQYGCSARTPPIGIIGNLPQRSSDYFPLNPPPPTGNHIESGNRWWWGSGPDLSSHIPPRKLTNKPKAEPSDGLENEKKVAHTVEDMAATGKALKMPSISTRLQQLINDYTQGEARVGDRGCVMINGERVLGMVKYVGLFDPYPDSGLWCGIKLDRPMGKHDGVVRGKRYFSCEENHGLFVKLEKVIPLGPTGGKRQSTQEQKRINT